MGLQGTRVILVMNCQDKRYENAKVTDSGLGYLRNVLVSSFVHSNISINETLCSYVLTLLALVLICSTYGTR